MFVWRQQEINMAPVMDIRKRFQRRFEKNTGANLVSRVFFFVKAAVHALKSTSVEMLLLTAMTSFIPRLLDIGVP
jgi:pyruvate/2-oxoglutarate dehydrogenase complex dihydrolipoamide acyltransferase (E2) component